MKREPRWEIYRTDGLLMGHVGGMTQEEAEFRTWLFFRESDWEFYVKRQRYVLKVSNKATDKRISHNHPIAIHS